MGGSVKRSGFDPLQRLLLSTLLLAVLFFGSTGDLLWGDFEDDPQHESISCLQQQAAAGIS